MVEEFTQMWYADNASAGELLNNLLAIICFALVAMFIIITLNHQIVLLW